MPYTHAHDSAIRWRERAWVALNARFGARVCVGGTECTIRYLRHLMQIRWRECDSVRACVFEAFNANSVARVRFGARVCVGGTECTIRYLRHLMQIRCASAIRCASVYSWRVMAGRLRAHAHRSLCARNGYWPPPPCFLKISMAGRCTSSYGIGRKVASVISGSRFTMNCRFALC